MSVCTCMYIYACMYIYICMDLCACVCERSWGLLQDLTYIVFLGGRGGGGGGFVNMDLLLNSAPLIHGQHTLNGSQTLTQFVYVWAWLLSVSPPPHCIGVGIRGPLANAQNIRGYELRSPYTWVQCTHSLLPRPRFPTAADGLHHRYVESGLHKTHFPRSGICSC